MILMKSILSISLILFLFSCQRDFSKKDEIEDHKAAIVKAGVTDASQNGIVYFSFDNALTWQNKSEGLPRDITLTDIAVSSSNIFASTKQNGIFIYDFQTNRWNNTVTKPETSKDVDVIGFYKGEIILGTGGDGIFVSIDNGKTWSSHNKGIENLTIRRITVIGGKVFIGTNGGLYSLNAMDNKWELEFGHHALQVNGITTFDDDVYIGTNEGVYKSNKQNKDWKQSMQDVSLHNISSDSKNVYALAYNELFSSADKGETWINIQKGLPKNLYTFQLREKEEHILIGQWDGVYKREGTSNWILVNKGLPKKFPATDLIIFNDILVVSSSGWVTNKP